MVSPFFFIFGVSRFIGGLGEFSTSKHGEFVAICGAVIVLDVQQFDESVK